MAGLFRFTRLLPVRVLTVSMLVLWAVQASVPQASSLLILLSPLLLFEIYGIFDQMGKSRYSITGSGLVVAFLMMIAGFAWGMISFSHR